MSVLQQQELFDEIKTLPIELKAKIVEQILLDMNPIDNSIDKLWIEEINKRKQEIEDGTVELIDGEEFFKEIKQRLQN